MFELLCFAFWARIVEEDVALDARSGTWYEQSGASRTRWLALVELQNGAEAPQYVAGTENFYVITRYNWSSYYAMAVLELGREVKAAMER